MKQFKEDRWYLATGTKDHTVEIWDPISFERLKTLEGHIRAVGPVSFSPDGKYLASGSEDNTVKIWEVPTFKCIGTLRAQNLVLSVCFSGDGKYLAAGSDCHSIKIWEVQTSTCLATLGSHQNWVSSLSFSHDGKYIASFYKTAVEIWEVQTSKSLTTPEGHTDAVTCLSFDQDGKYLVSGSWDKTVKIWDVSASKCFATLRTNYLVNSVSISNDEKYIASESSGFVFEVQTPKALRLSSGVMTCVNFSNDGQYFAAVTGVEVKIWDAKTFEYLATLLDGQSNIYSVCFSSDGKYLAAGHGKYADQNWTFKVNIWDVSDVSAAKCLTTLEDFTASVNCMSFSNGGKYLAIGSDKTVKIWDVSACKYLATLEGHTAVVASVSFSNDGKHVASGSADNTVKIWEVESFSYLEILLPAQVRAVSFSRDGKYLAAGSDDKAVRIWKNVNDKWFYDKLFSPVGNPLSARNIRIEQVVISSRNRQILEQLTGPENKEEEAKTNPKEEEMNTNTIDDFQGELEYNPIFAQNWAKEFSELFLRNQIPKYEEHAKQKYLRLNL